MKVRKVMADASTQGTSPEDAPSWSTFDIGRAMTALRSGTPDVQRRILRRLHVRWWHATPTKMIGILKQAGIRGPVLELCKDVCNTCRICKDWIPPGNKPMAKTRMSTAFNDVMQADLLFWKDSIILHMIDECTRFSVLAIVADKHTNTLCSAMRMWWFKMFQPPKILIVDQEGGFDSYDAGIFLERCGVHRQQKPTDMHAAMVERHNALVRKLLHSIDSQTTLEGLPVTDQDIVSEACYAKNNMLEIGGAHPITAVLGIQPSILPDFENTSLSVRDDF